MSRQIERGVPRAPRLTMGSWWMYTPHFLTSSAARAQKSCLEATCFVSLFVSCNIWVNEAKSKSWRKLLVLPRWFNVLARRQVTNLTGSETCFFWKAGLANVLISHDNPYVESLQTCLPQLFAVGQRNLIFWMHQFKHLNIGGASTKLLRSGGAPTVYFCCLYSFLWDPMRRGFSMFLFREPKLASWLHPISSPYNLLSWSIVTPLIIVIV